MGRDTTYLNDCSGTLVLIRCSLLQKVIYGSNEVKWAYSVHDTPKYFIVLSYELVTNQKREYCKMYFFDVEQSNLVFCFAEVTNISTLTLELVLECISSTFNIWKN